MKSRASQLRNLVIPLHSGTQKDQSFAFSSSTEVQDVINFLQNIDAVKCAAIDIRKSLLDVNFELENSFCDAHQLKQSWKETKILHVPF